MDNVITLVESKLTDFKEMINGAKESNIDTVLLHQDAFASDYSDDEIILLGSAIKYAGLHGINVTIHGTNGETLG